MKTLVSVILSFIVAALSAAILASLFSTQFVVTGLQEVAVVIPFATRMKMTLGDLAILKTLLPIIVLCFTVAFTIASLCYKKWHGKRQLWFGIAGGCALVSVLLGMSFAMQLMPVAGARTVFGLITQFIAGAAGGLIFARLHHPASNKGALNKGASND